MDYLVGAFYIWMLGGFFGGLMVCTARETILDNLNIAVPWLILSGPAMWIFAGIGYFFRYEGPLKCPSCADKMVVEHGKGRFRSVVCPHCGWHEDIWFDTATIMWEKDIWMKKDKL